MTYDLNTQRHSTAHLLASAVQKLWPKTKFGIGPVTKDGFYYDFEFPTEIIENDLSKIEDVMNKLKKQDLPFERSEISISEAIKMERERGQIYKVELLEQIESTGDTKVDHEENINLEKEARTAVKKVTYYKSGEFLDLCRGPHVKSTGQIGHFKLLNITGAYWRGAETNKMLTRIYGVTWETEKQLKEYTTKLELAKSRDHKKIGTNLKLFTFLPQAPGMPFWYSKGFILLNELKEFAREINKKYGYHEISTPFLAKKEVWEQSGHWDLFRDDMFVFNIDKETYALKPMNCPETLLLYNSEQHSHKDLPIKLSDLDYLHRNEASGTLNGLFRTREFSQDDAHIICSNEQIRAVVGELIDMATEIFSVFRFKPTYYLATKPDKALGEASAWKEAETLLSNTLKEKNVEHYLKPKDGAFYGPKIDLHIEDALGRNWQLATIQLDFQMPKRFRATYINGKGAKETPIMIHRAILGSFERFIAILIEHFAGGFPTWLAPIQVVVIPITDRTVSYSQNIVERLKAENIRAKADVRSETLQSRIRDSQLEKIPYMIIIGDKEQVQKKISLRSMEKGDEGIYLLDNFIARLKDEIKTRK